ncbi:Hypothetical predicted protein [Olea europaea subsp. europaea]|uniref:Uncharacterized protein n=1 Tax=Olea europaea subsp. europaea TaxID=158383 RepID=A0A8S0T9A0_OLEEU|nr:Hypothetical predicted protein [Olea europaea subsp. europaea]
MKNPISLSLSLLANPRNESPLLLFLSSIRSVNGALHATPHPNHHCCDSVGRITLHSTVVRYDNGNVDVIFLPSIMSGVTLHSSRHSDDDIVCFDLRTTVTIATTMTWCVIFFDLLWVVLGVGDKATPTQLPLFQSTATAASVCHCFCGSAEFRPKLEVAQRRTKKPIKEIALAVSLLVFGALGIFLSVSWNLGAIMAVNNVGSDH